MAPADGGGDQPVPSSLPFLLTCLVVGTIFLLLLNFVGGWAAVGWALIVSTVIVMAATLK